MAREIRHAVYLTGGLVLLALGIPEVADGLGAFAGCALQLGYCPGGYSNGFLAETAPAVIGAAVLIVIAIVLLLMARSTRRSN